ncbi:MAG: mechanosensitive ion channel family protein [Rikenellaceae bacterium]
MKKIVFALLILLTTLSCKSHSNKYVVTPTGDTIASDFVIGERRVGDIDRGATINRLFKIYGENQVKQLKAPSQDALQRDSSEVAIYYVYDKANHLLMIARSQGNDGVNNEIKSLIIKDEKFTTSKGITINSTVEELRAAYPDAMVVQYESRFFVFVSSLDLYLRVDERNIRGYDPEFLSDIPIDSLVQGARFENMSVSWQSNSTNILTPQFWHDLMTRVLRWLIYELPVILFIILIFVVSKRLLSFSFNKINTVARRRVEADDELDSSEAVKRVDTITGILHGVLNIILWSIFVLILLSKFNINIAPILASAGILGLAVGFGAQELVRDFISGFFILLEDQLRTGDMAIINGTTGVVEKIELRTVTLRDPSGVVHIFQNGKINSLSNMTKEWSAIVLEIGVAYKEDVDRVIKIMKEVGAELRASHLGNLMLDDVEVWGLDSFADSAVVIKLVIKTRPMKQWRIKREYQRLLKIRFDAEGIEIPFPHVTLYTGEQTKPMPLSLRDEKNK